MGVEFLGEFGFVREVLVGRVWAAFLGVVVEVLVGWDSKEGPAKEAICMLFCLFFEGNQPTFWFMASCYRSSQRRVIGRLGTELRANVNFAQDDLMQQPGMIFSLECLWNSRVRLHLCMTISRIS